MYLLTDAGLGERLHREGLEHEGIYLQWPGERHHIDFRSLTGRWVCVYRQTEVGKEMVAARLTAGLPLHLDVSHAALHDVNTDRPPITFTDAAGDAQRLDCDVVVGADDSHP